MTGRRERRRKQLLDDLTERRGYCKSHCVENWLWKRLWACRKTDYGDRRKERKITMDARFSAETSSERVNDILRNICCLTEACGELTL